MRRARTANRWSEDFEYSSGTNPHVPRASTESLPAQLDEHRTRDPLRARRASRRRHRGRASRCLRSDWLTQGPAIDALRAAVRRLCRAPHAVAVSNATAALHIACLALGLGPGRPLVDLAQHLRRLGQLRAATAAPTSISSISTRAPTTCRARRWSASSRGRKRRAACRRSCVPVALRRACACDMQAIRALGAALRFPRHRGRLACGRRAATAANRSAMPLADIAVFSFHPVKIVTTGEGGLR